MGAELLAIAAGFALLACSADRLVSGASALAFHLSISPLIIGLIIVSFGTSAPEVLISAKASWQGNPGLATGNALGSNIINTSLPELAASIASAMKSAHDIAIGNIIGSYRFLSVPIC